ncbi:ras association domain-containing protein 10 [Dendropsophus ebraccatus]|uniref:ras association domain-containing protein 10 n=1 Tax=Dendropsophus ebraccatus TaxID=150705 RepID=UPI0038311B6E
MDAEEEWKISVWLCEEEKLVSGLSRRTTCADVVRVLLEDYNAQQPPGEASLLLGPPHAYCMVEKWRGFERTLPNKTKILRLWTAWGEEQENVRFVLLRTAASLPNIGPRSAEAKVVLSRESPCPFKGAPQTSSSTATLSQEKQRRVVRKAFRKLAKMNKKRQETKAVEKMETLVHLVLSQDHTIRQQLQRIKDLDRDIDRYQAKIHFDRMRRHGVNYVQDTYLVGVVPEKSTDGEDQECEEELFVDFEDYARKCEGILLLQDQISQQEALIEEITGQIQEELNKRWMDRRQEELSSKDQDPHTAMAGDEEECENELLLQQERVKTELSASLYIGLRLNTDLEAVKADLDYSQQVWNEKESELQGLLESLGALEVSEEAAEELRPGCSQGPERTCTQGPGVWGGKDGGRCTNCEGNDEDSDTGLSSMHSQDSDSTPVCESLV